MVVLQTIFRNIIVLTTSAAPFIDQDHPKRSHFGIVLRYTGQLSLLPGVVNNNHDDNSNTDGVLEILDDLAEEIVDDDISQQHERQRQCCFGEEEEEGKDESDHENSDDETDDSEGDDKNYDSEGDKEEAINNKVLVLADDESGESSDNNDSDASVETLWSLASGKDEDGVDMSSEDEVNHDKESLDDLVGDVAIFLHPFLYEVRRGMYNELMSE